jgi:beta-N-acetylhexosaminidase
MPTTQSDDLDRSIGQMIMTGFKGTSFDPQNHFLRQIQYLPPGLVVLFDHDVAGNSPFYNVENPDQLRLLTRAIQTSSPEPILFATDQEGGRVSRLDSARGFASSETARSVGARGDLAFTRRLAVESARSLADVGIRLNLAPVVDLDLNPANPIIGGKERSYSADPEVVIAHATQVVQAHHENGVLCTLKHFPGQGSAPKDTHAGSVDATGEWQEIELDPFRRMIAGGLCDAVMTAHISNANLDPDWPASLSRKVVTGILRERLGFDGVVITDDLQMNAISESFGLETAVAKAIEAGVDVLTFANNSADADPEIFARVVAVVRLLVRQGFVTPGRIAQSVHRIRDLKAKSAALHAATLSRDREATNESAKASINVGGPIAKADLHAELAGCYQDLLQIDEEARELLAGLTEEQVRWSPGPECWSVGDCLEHLTIVGSLVVTKIREAVDRGWKEGVIGTGPYHYSWPGRMFIESLQPGSRIRVKTVRLYTPSQSLAKEELLKNFLEQQNGYRNAMTLANGLDLVRVKVASPANRWLRLSLGVWFAAMVAHEKRHLEQARRVILESEFPK